MKPGSSSTRRIVAPSGTATAEFEVPKSIAQNVESGMAFASGWRRRGAILKVSARGTTRFLVVHDPKRAVARYKAAGNKVVAP